MQIRIDLPLSQIKTDRHPLNPRVLSLIDHLARGGSVPPIHVLPDGKGQFRILDGRHRFLAFKLLGRKQITVRYGIRDNNGNQDRKDPQVPTGSATQAG